MHDIKLIQKEGKEINIENEPSFYNLICESLFLSLYEQNKLTKGQYEKCIEKIKKQ